MSVTVNLSIPDSVLVGDDLLGDLVAHLGALSLPGKRCAIVTDSNVAPLYGEGLLQQLMEGGFDPRLITIPAGEASKSLAVVETICRDMIGSGLDRRAFLIALGGGVVGAVAGFAAAVFYRGVPCIQVPTTIVAQVDSSVGGKTGVNTPEGKNLVGAFHQPALVLADTGTLRTLPPREYREGFAEVIKHAAIRDAAMIPLIGKVAAGEGRGGLAPLIERNVAIKAAIVVEDEKEISGTRALLNFGHTIGHAIESAAGYGELLHGEAIALGIRAALAISREVSGLSAKEAATINALLDQFELPATLDPAIETPDLLKRLGRDKKFQEGRIMFVLLRSLGDAFLSDDVSLEQIEGAIEALR